MNYTLNEEILDKVERDMGQIVDHMETGYQMLKELLDDIGTSGEWKGGSEKAFLAYMDLLKQYHRCFSSESSGQNPLPLAAQAFSDLINRSAVFYDEFTEYRYLREID